jgi:hypothetical protein
VVDWLLDDRQYLPGVEQAKKHQLISIFFYIYLEHVGEQSPEMLTRYREIEKNQVLKVVRWVA